MIKTYFLPLLLLGLSSYSQNPKDFANKKFLASLNNNPDYKAKREKITQEYLHSQPGNWGEFVKGVDEDLITDQKYIAFTFDGCGGEKGTGYDSELIEYLRKEKIPVTLFVSGKWIDAHFETFLNLSKDKLFEIENHGLNHKPCSIDGESEYGIHGTPTVGAAFDEIEANALKIEAITHRKPTFYRSSTAFIDEACARMAAELGITPISFQVLSGDAVAFTPTTDIEQNVLKNIKPGAIVIMHFNHPQWNTYEALRLIIPKLKAEGYQFVQLKDYKEISERSGK